MTRQEEFYTIEGYADAVKKATRKWAFCKETKEKRRNFPQRRNIYQQFTSKSGS